ncbi:hypothetical protein CSPX01_13585 [Colletotrichum filicis]|nr:hypothetical protein CSPX01_13585 [Colletotrichum filicis]
MNRQAWRAFSQFFRPDQQRSATAAMAPYTISIRNQSGAESSYAVFSEVPRIKSGVSDMKITTRIMLSVQGVASGSGQASFVMSKQLYATCGTYDVDNNQAKLSPNSFYQIKPSKIFYVTIGEHNVRDLVLDDLRSAPSTCRIDFGNPETDDIQLVHSEFGVLNRIAAAVD